GAKSGQRILIHAGSGGVGTFAFQYAKHLRLHVTSTTSSKNADFVASLAADRIIAYDRENYLQQDGNYDIVYDTLGGAFTVDAFKVVKRGGVVLSLSGPPDRESGRAQSPRPAGGHRRLADGTEGLRRQRGRRGALRMVFYGIQRRP